MTMSCHPNKLSEDRVGNRTRVESLERETLTSARAYKAYTRMSTALLVSLKMPGY